MKKTFKTFFAVVGIATAVFNMSAINPSYRGFAEAGVAFGPSSPDYGMGSEYKESDGVAISFATSHGLQFNRSFFVGAGLGVNKIVRNGYDKFAQLALFIDGRWDLNVAKKVSPFVDLRLGYASNFDSEDFDVFKSNPYSVGESVSSIDDLGQVPCNQFYFQPTVGVRFRLHHHIGLNIGVTYFTRKRIDVIADNSIITDIKSWNKNQIGLIIGVDF